jgi:molybdopterin converting factor small subunit
MKINVKSIAVFHSVPPSMELSVPAGTDMAGLVRHISVSYPEFGETLVIEGEIHSQVIVLQNGVSIRQREGLASVLEEGDELYVVPMIHGG